MGGAQAPWSVPPQVISCRDVVSIETKALGPPASTCSEMEVYSEADILDLLLVELAVGGIPIEVLHQ